jgi:hypothetical protein
LPDEKERREGKEGRKEDRKMKEGGDGEGKDGEGGGATFSLAIVSHNAGGNANFPCRVSTFQDSGLGDTHR